MTTFSLGTDFTGAPLLPRYVNGRLLGAADLTTDQETLRTRDRWVGQAAGRGVVRGLEVTASATTLTVAPGLGLNGNGEPISLTTTATLPLAVPLAEVAPTDPARFRCCDSGPGPTSGAVVAAGIYLLTARPASRTEGSTATAAAPGTGGTGGCAASWTAAGVEFRVTTLAVPSTLLDIELTTGNRRNLVAHWCYGSDQLAELPRDPFSFPTAYGLDRVSELTADDLPLAAFGWDGQAISDLDGWAARRRVVLPEPGADGWSVLTSDRRIADGQARFAQFQQQVDELVDRQLAKTTRAPEVFGLLPPAGLLPVDSNDLKKLLARLVASRVDEGTEIPALDDAAQGAVGSGFSLQRFFGNLAVFGGILDWGLAELLLRESWYRPPVPTGAVEDEDDGDGFDERLLDRADTGADDRDKDRPGDDDTGDDRRRRGDERRSDPPNRPLTVYFVWQNLIELGRVGASRERRRAAGFSINRSNVYVVFVANYLAVGPRPPLVTVSQQQGPVVVVPHQNPF